jgi:hypothetical protein
VATGTFMDFIKVKGPLKYLPKQSMSTVSAPVRIRSFFSTSTWERVEVAHGDDEPARQHPDRSAPSESAEEPGIPCISDLARHRALVTATSTGIGPVEPPLWGMRIS